MRWLFAVLIALFCWAGTVSGQKLCPAQLKPAPSALSNLIDDGASTLSDYQQAFRPQADLRRKIPGKLALLLSRIHSYPSSLFYAAPLTPAYALTQELGNSKPPRQAAPNWLHQLNWTLHSSRQQSRIGGWKESNMLYRGTLTYHS